VGIHVLNRLAAARGVPFPGEDGPIHAFPRPQDLSGAAVEELRALGLSRQKGRFLLELAQRILEEKLDLEALAALADAAALEQLRSFRGVGRWTGEYALLRGLGRWHLFPGDDVGARKRLEEWLNLSEPLDYEGVHRVLQRWRPYGGLLYFHFLLEGLSREGHLA
jgi:DNA-3-methyladenine glycosylase II